jgi:hypothetical protein
MKLSQKIYATIHTLTQGGRLPRVAKKKKGLQN